MKLVRIKGFDPAIKPFPFLRLIAWKGTEIRNEDKD